MSNSKKSKKNLKANQKPRLLGSSPKIISVVIGLIILSFGSFLWFQSPFNNSNAQNEEINTQNSEQTEISTTTPVSEQTAIQDSEQVNTEPDTATEIQVDAEPTEEIEKVASLVDASVIDASVVDASVNDLAEAISSEAEYIIVDVREQWEYDRGHVPGVTLIPLGELQARAAELPNDKTLYIICQSGVRSTRASNMLLKTGKLDIRNVVGGTAAWARAGLPIETGP